MLALITTAIKQLGMPLEYVLRFLIHKDLGVFNFQDLYKKASLVSINQKEVNRLLASFFKDRALDIRSLS